MLLDGEALLGLGEAVLGDGGQPPVDVVGLGHQARQLGLILVGAGERRSQLLVERLPLGGQLDEPLIGPAEDRPQGKRLVVGQVEAVDEAQHEVGPCPVAGGSGGAA